jgi:hypothetical protein
LDPQLRDSLGPPPLYKGESEKEYSFLWERLRSEVRPRDVIEEMYVRDVIDYAWETRRYRRLKAKLLEASRAKGLWRVLCDLVPNPGDRMKLVSDWACDKLDARRKVAEMMQTAGLDESAIEAQTFAALIGHIEQIDRLSMLADGRMVALLREIEHHRSSFGRQLRETIPEIEDVEFESLTGPAQTEP